MNIFSFIQSLEPILSEELPGKTAQHQMMTQPRVLADPPYKERDAVQASVLILLFPDKNDIRFFLMKRTHDVAHHKGQISLPGGILEQTETLENAALRETHEEIGVLSKKVTLTGKLTPLFIPFTGFNVHPFVGWTSDIPTISMNAAEVKHVFSVSIFDLINDKVMRNEEVTYKGQAVTLPYFLIGDEKVWGATAMILSEFKTILRKIV